MKKIIRKKIGDGFLTKKAAGMHGMCIPIKKSSQRNHERQTTALHLRIDVS